MDSTQILRARRRTTVDYIGLANDAAAVIYICVIFALATAVRRAEIIAESAFFLTSAANAYLKGRKLSIIAVWGALFYGFCVISSLWAFSASGAAALGAALIKILILIPSVMFYASDRKGLNIIYKSFILGAALLLVRLLIYTPAEQWGMVRLGESIGYNENAVGMRFAYASAVCLYYTKKTKMFFIPYSLYVLMALLSGSRKALILVLLAIVLYCISKMKKPANVLYVIPFGLVFYFIIYSVQNNPLLYHLVGRRMEFLFNYFKGEGEIGNSTRIRMELINLGIEQFKEHPLIGYGLNSFRYMNKYTLYAHNNYIELLVNYGVIGTALYYALPIATLTKLLLSWLRNKSQEIFLAIILITMTLMSDYGMVSYYNEYTIIILITTYYAAVLYGGEAETAVKFSAAADK